MSEIRTKPSTKEYRENFDKIKRVDCTKYYKVIKDPDKAKTIIIVNNDPHFGG